MKNTYIMLIAFLLFPILRISGLVANEWSTYPISTEKYLVFFLLITSEILFYITANILTA